MHPKPFGFLPGSTVDGSEIPARKPPGMSQKLDFFFKRWWHTGIKLPNLKQVFALTGISKLPVISCMLPPHGSIRSWEVEKLNRTEAEAKPKGEKGGTSKQKGGAGARKILGMSS